MVEPAPVPTRSVAHAHRQHHGVGIGQCSTFSFNFHFNIVSPFSFSSGLACNNLFFSRSESVIIICEVRAYFGKQCQVPPFSMPSKKLKSIVSDRICKLVADTRNKQLANDDLETVTDDDICDPNYTDSSDCLSTSGMDSIESTPTKSPPKNFQLKVIFNASAILFHRLFRVQLIGVGSIPNLV